jgi:hypothetical protein
VKCSAKVAGEVILGGVGDGDMLAKAMKLYEEIFPLSASTATTTTAPGAEYDGRKNQLRYEKNGKRVIEMTLSLLHPRISTR